MSQSHIEAHVDLIAKHEQEFLAKRTPGQRLGDRIAAWVGSFTFVILHVCFFVLWISGITSPAPLGNSIHIRSLCSAQS